MPVGGIGGQGTTGEGNAAAAAAAAASAAAAAAANAGVGTGPGGHGPPSVADAGGGTGGHGSSPGSVSGSSLGPVSLGASYSGRRGHANPMAAAMMNAELGKGITETGNPATPFGEMSPQQQSQIASMIAANQDASVVSGLMSAVPVIGPVLSLLSKTGLISLTDPANEAVANAYGEGTLSGLFGSYSKDPGIQAATEAHFGDRAAAHNALMEGRGPEGPGHIPTSQTSEGSNNSDDEEEATPLLLSSLAQIVGGYSAPSETNRALWGYGEGENPHVGLWVPDWMQWATPPPSAADGTEGAPADGVEGGAVNQSVMDAVRAIIERMLREREGTASFTSPLQDVRVSQ